MAAQQQEVFVPDIGDFKDVEIIEVMVKPGDTIQPEDPLITLESDKAAIEVPSPSAGVVKSMKVKVGDRVSKGSPILILEFDGKGVGDSVAVPSQPAANVEAPKPVQTAAPIKEAPRSEPAAPSKAPAAAPRDQEILVPDIGDFKDIEVIELFVKPGDRIKREDPLLTLESDKAAMEVPSPAEGIVKTLKLKKGDRVSKGALILVLETEGEATAHPAAFETPAAKASAPEASEPAPRAETATRQEPARATPIREEGGHRAPPHASPAIRKFARELGADLGKIQGTGPKGRILRTDIQEFVKQSLQRAAQPQAAGPFAFPQPPEIDFSQFGVIEQQPLSRIKKISGAHLHRSWVGIPHVTQYDEADITDLEAFRVSLKREAEQRSVKLTFLPFVIKAVVAALKAYPSFNASLARDGEALILKRYFHIGVAVDTPDGLLVPVLRDADQKSVFDLAAELVEIGGRARAKKLRNTDLEGGCFTITSLGGIGGTAFTPIINAPEVGILGLSRAATKPIYKDGQFVPRLMLPLSLSYDHRVIDGAEAARFVTYLSTALEDLRRVLL